MIHYHGGPITPQPVGLAVWTRRHAMVSYADTRQMELAAEVTQSFAIDNGAYSVWKQGGKLDVPGYLEFVRQWELHPGFDWALIPDVIEGTELENDALIETVTAGHWPFHWVPIWHLHESLERLRCLATSWPRVALGSSGEYATIGTLRWWGRINEAMKVVCDEEGYPKCKLHGLRMMDPTIFAHIPFSSVDSTNVARNCGLDTKWPGRYKPLSEEARALVLVDRIEHHASAVRWNGSSGLQRNFELIG